MLKDISVLLKNNLISIAIYLCMCFILIPFNIAWEGDIWHDLIWEWGVKSIIFNWSAIIVHTTTSFFLFFWLGKKFLTNTNILSNVFSVINIYIIVAIIIFILYDKPTQSRWEGLLMIPVYPISETISYFFSIKLKYCFLVTPLLPSIMMWIGMTSFPHHN